MSSVKRYIPVDDGMARLLYEQHGLNIYLSVTYSKSSKKYSMHRYLCTNLISCLFKDKSRVDTSRTISVKSASIDLLDPRVKDWKMLAQYIKLCLESGLGLKPTKRRGKHRVCFTVIVVADDDQTVLYYQPIINWVERSIDIYSNASLRAKGDRVTFPSLNEFFLGGGQ